MNGRIQELAEQAWSMVSNEELQRGELYEADQQRMRRDQVFAELIIRECINEIHGADVGYLYGKSYYLDRVAEHIEKQFGIQP